MNKLRSLSKTTKSNSVTIGIIVIAYFVLQAMVSTGSISSRLEGLLVPVCYYIILAVSLNLTVGILGELSLGHAGFMCVGAFTSAFFSKLTEKSIDSSMVRFTLAIVVGAVFAAIFGVIISLSVTRLSGDYLAIVTLAFGEIVKNVVNVLYVGVDGRGIHFSLKDVASLGLDEKGKVIIQGARGIARTPQDATFTIAAILVLITVLVIINLINSRTGRAIMAVRDNRIAAESVGIDIKKYRIMAFSISAAFAGVAGVLYAHFFSTLNATPKNFGYNMSITILVFVVLGGMGKIRGSMIAAVILTLLPEYLRALEDYRMLIYAIVLIVMMIANWNPAIVEWRKMHSVRKLFGKGNRKSAKEAE